ncbi:outer membrane protein assembly factor BamD [bacterium]|nr:outer membrane protein assembly factor BamD [Candidatus Omnitrophota bacterium]MBU2528370.1 outer membrane protein assembly factor BamD [bacterium]MBU3930628.1 outer membrane protein assembly factor BamD [bacterium]
MRLRYYSGVVAVLLVSVVISSATNNAESEKALVERARAFWSDRKYENAEDIYKNLLEKYPTSVWSDEYKLEMINCYRITNKYDEAIRKCNEFIKNRPESYLISTIRYSLMSIYVYHKNDLEKGEGQANIIIKEFPGTVYEQYALGFLANIYRRQKKTDKFVEIALDSLKKYPDSCGAVWLHYSMGKIYLDRKNYSKALVEFRQSFENRTKDMTYASVSCNSIFYCLKRQKDYEAAAAWAEKCIDKYSDEFSTEYLHYSLVLLYPSRLKQQKKADKAYAAFKMKYPNSKYTDDLEDRLAAMRQEASMDKLLLNIKDTDSSEEEVIDLK